MQASLQKLALYNQWINKRIYSAAGKLNQEALSENRGAYFGSIIGTLNHILVGDIFWFKRFAQHLDNYQSLEYFRSVKKPTSLDEILHDELFELSKVREHVDAVIVQFISELTDEMIASTLKYKNSKGQEFNKNMGDLLLHVFNHQTHHRGQVSTLLYQAGIDVGVTDMVVGIAEK
jgi:uncharacterized damage-inducible protein DinB